MKTKKENQAAIRQPEPEAKQPEIKQPEPKAEAQPEVKGVLSLFSAIYCAECQRALTAAFSSKGKLQLQHDRSDCIHAGKHFEPPTVTLREAKP